MGCSRPDVSESARSASRSSILLPPCAAKQPGQATSPSHWTSSTCHPSLQPAATRAVRGPALDHPTEPKPPGSRCHGLRVRVGLQRRGPSSYRTRRQHPQHGPRTHAPRQAPRSLHQSVDARRPAPVPRRGGPAHAMRVEPLASAGRLPCESNGIRRPVHCPAINTSLAFTDLGPAREPGPAGTAVRPAGPRLGSGGWQGRRNSCNTAAATTATGATSARDARGARAGGRVGGIGRARWLGGTRGRGASAGTPRARCRPGPGGCCRRDP